MFVFFNPNPDAKRVGDCTVRAIAKAMNTVWDMAELNTFASIIKILGDTERADHIDLLMKMMPVGGFSACATDRSKEDKTDG